MDRVAGLDGLRVLSAVGVVVYHVLGAALGPNPTVGVILPPVALVFFVISGYVIYRPYAAAEIGRTPLPALGTYYTSRLLRVLPMWWVAVGTYLVVFGTDRLDGPLDWILTLSLLQALDADIRYVVNGPAWALSFEWVFYLTAPLWGRFTSTLRRTVAPRVLPARFQLAALVPLLVAIVVTKPARPFVAIVVGVALAILDAERARTGRTPAVIQVLRSPAITVVATLAAWVVLVVYPYQEGLSVEWAEGDFRVLLIWTAVATIWFVPIAFRDPRGSIVSLLASRQLVWLANLTFGLYLWHELFLRLVLEHLGADLHLGAAMYLVAVPSFVLAMATFYGVERPMMVFRRRLGRDLAPIPPNPSVPGLAALDRRAVPRVRFSALDGLRVPAAVAVILFHVIAASGGPSWAVRAVAVAAPMAAATFLVISGFVQHHPWASAVASVAKGGTVAAGEVDGGLLRGWARRALRLYPLYWVALLAAWNQRMLEGIDGAVELLQVVFLLPLPDQAVLLDHGLGPIVWVLSAEIVLAVAVPVVGRIGLAAARRGRRSADVPLGVLAAIGAAAGIAAESGRWALLAVPCVVAGLLLSDLDARQRRARRRSRAVRTLARSSAPLLLAVAAITALEAARIDPAEATAPTGLFEGRTIPLVAVGAILVFLATAAPQRSTYRRLLGSRALVVASSATYGAHLFVVPVIAAVLVHSEPPTTLLAAVALAGAWVAGGIGHVTVEAPLVPAARVRSGGRESADARRSGARPTEEDA